MTLAWLALLGLVGVLVVGAIRTDLNVGVLAMALAFVIGTAGAGLAPTEFGALLPGNLLLTLVGVTLFFELLRQNGTLDQITQRILKLARGDSKRLPVVFFFLTFISSALGPGNIASTALIAPVAMRVGVAAGVHPVLMAIVVCTGANAGTFSPVAVTGSINTELMRSIGLDQGLNLHIFGMVALIQTVSAVLAYLIFQGWKTHASETTPQPETPARAVPLDWKNRVSLLALACFILAVIVLKWPASMAAFLLVAVMTVLKVAPSEDSIKNLPWSVILLISGISVLVALLEKTSSLELLTSMLAQYTPQGFLHAALAFVAGLASVGSSSSGVVMPLFIPLVPELVSKLGGGSLQDAVVAIDVGSHMVDVSPLSTLGALCLAALPEQVNRSRVFKGLLLWGLCMTVVGAVLAYVILDVF